ncbi:MAG TPA: septation protein A [Rhodocyclaceae bacterium]|nr:septation protein A [Rhodocyclaceae bacterium]
MKLLFDFFPVILFYAAFKYAKSHSAWAAQKATEWLGFMVSGGAVGANDAPTVLATVVIILAIAAQILWLTARKQKVNTMLWVGLGLVLVFGGATIWFHNANFIKWKFSIFYWAMATAFWLSQIFMKQSVLQNLLGSEIKLSESVWKKLNTAWVMFFGLMGFLNMYVFYNFSEDAWYNFKLFGGIGLTMLFGVGQALFLSRHLQKESN